MTIATQIVDRRVTRTCQFVRSCTLALQKSVTQIAVCKIGDTKSRVALL